MFPSTLHPDSPAHHVDGGAPGVFLDDLILRGVGVPVERKVEQAKPITKGDIGGLQLGGHLVTALAAKQGHADTFDGI